MLYLTTSLSNINFVPYVHLKKTTQFIFKWTCFKCIAYRFTHILYIMLISVKTLLHHAICACWDMVNLCYELEIFFKKIIVPMQSIYDFEDSFSIKSLWLSINRPCLLSEMYVLTLVRKRGVVWAINFTYTKSLLDTLTWNVSSWWLSYAPSFFAIAFQG